jgi:hypothetical protein
MIIFHYDPTSGICLGQGEADESPLEPGVWLIPAYATEVAPPAIGAGERAVWKGAAWEVETIPVVPSPEPDGPPDPPEPVQSALNFQGFLNGVISSELYPKIIQQSIGSPQVNTAFTAAMGALILAALGLPNLEALQAGVWQLLGSMTVEPGDIEIVQALLVTNGLDGVISLTPPPAEP